MTFSAVGGSGAGNCWAYDDMASKEMETDIVATSENKVVPIYLRVVVNFVSLSGPTVSKKMYHLLNHN